MLLFFEVSQFLRCELSLILDFVEQRVSLAKRFWGILRIRRGGLEFLNFEFQIVHSLL